MKMFTRTALLGAIALVALSLPADAARPVTVADAPLAKASAAQQLTQRSEAPAFFKQSKKAKKKKPKK